MRQGGAGLQVEVRVAEVLQAGVKVADPAAEAGQGAHTVDVAVESAFQLEAVAATVATEGVVAV